MRIGVDVGGTKTEAIALDDHGTELYRRRIATPDGYDQFLVDVTVLLAETESAAGPARSVGFGTPGAISPATGLMKNSNSVMFNGKALKSDLENALGREIRLANDADCLAMSEAIDGAASGAPTVFAAILGTGVGGGIAINQQLLAGPNAIAGEWGHNPLPWPTSFELPGPACYCGLSGCIETWISGTGLAADHQRQTGTELRAEEIVASEDLDARESIDRYVGRLARSLASIINVLDPTVIVLGGGMSNVDLLYERVPEQWRQWVFSDRVDTKLVKAAHGDSSGVRGAAWLW